MLSQHTAEVSADLIDATDPRSEGGHNSPRPRIDPRVGAPRYVSGDRCSDHHHDQGTLHRSNSGASDRPRTEFGDQLRRRHDYPGVRTRCGDRLFLFGAGGIAVGSTSGQPSISNDDHDYRWGGLWR